MAEETRTTTQIREMLKQQVEDFKRVCPSAYTRCVAEVPIIGGKGICDQIREDVPAFGDDHFSQVVHEKWNPNYHPFKHPDSETSEVVS